MEKIAFFHGIIAATSIGYYFKVKGLESSFLTESFDTIVDIKNRITSEITEEITTLATPIPNVYIGDEESGGVKYFEGQANPLKGDKFKNWLDDYLEKEISFIFYYSNFKNLFAAWKKRKATLMNYSIFLCLVELVNMAICFYLSQACYNQTASGAVLSTDKLFCVSSTTEIIYFSGVLSLIFIFIGIFMFRSLDVIERRVLNFKGNYNGL